MEDKQYEEQKTVTWLAAGFMKDVRVQLLLCATEHLVWILIGSPTGSLHAVLLCVFPVTYVKLFVCCCVQFCVCICKHIVKKRKKN